MAIDGQRAEKLRGYLRELSPRARAMLLAELERGELRGAPPVPASDIIIRELRNADAAPSAPAGVLSDLEGHPARFFFAFLEPFFVDDAPEVVHQGRLARASARPIWEWIGRDLVPSEAKAYAENVGKLLAVNEPGRAAHAANAFHEKVAQAIDKALATVAGDDKARRKLAHQIGT